MTSKDQSSISPIEAHHVLIQGISDPNVFRVDVGMEENVETRIVNEDIGQNSESRVSESDEVTKDSKNLESLLDPIEPPCAAVIDGILDLSHAAIDHDVPHLDQTIGVMSRRISLLLPDMLLWKPRL